MKVSTLLLLISILALSTIFRIYGINWDNGFHMHPDERAIVIAVSNLSFPLSLHSFFSQSSPWNPHFFAYGSFPFYLLRIVGDVLGFFNPLYASYTLITIPGREISTMSDLLTVILLFLLGKRLFSQAIGLTASFLYGVSVLPIQLSHFYAVDTLLTFFILATLYFLILFYDKQKKSTALLVGLFFGLALATKISSSVLVCSLLFSLLLYPLLIVLKTPRRKMDLLLVAIKKFLFPLLIITSTAFIVFIICDPYSLIDKQTFIEQTQIQSEMTHNPFIFPYTLQYVGKIDYVYEAKNIFFFGLGPLLATICFLGVSALFVFAYKKRSVPIAILFSFFLPYVFVVGHFMVGFMRYMLPIYPLLTLFGAAFIYWFVSSVLHQKTLQNSFFACFIVLLIIWPVSFLSIYSQPNTRVRATMWINSHIKSGSTLAVEHWDDQLPLFDQEKYHFFTFPLYEPDTQEKWQLINKQLSQTDYIIIASNRLYVPLEKLTDCATLPPGRCYKTTAQYYKDLFSGKLHFREVAQFESKPTIPFVNRVVDDQSADESFTVYDHPKVIIFQKIH